METEYLGCVVTTCLVKFDKAAIIRYRYCDK